MSRSIYLNDWIVKASNMVPKLFLHCSTWLQVRGVIKRYFLLFCDKTQNMGTQWNHLSREYILLRKYPELGDPLMRSYDSKLPKYHIGLSKQCRSRWDAAECGISSGSILFATHPAIFRLNQVINCTCSKFRTSMVRSWDTTTSL